MLYEFLKELIEDIKNDGYLHKGKIYNEWIIRHSIRGLTISDVSYLLDERLENEGINTILERFKKR